MLAITILRDLSLRWSAAILNHQFHGSDTHKKIVQKTSSEILQLCATALCEMSLFFRLLIKISSRESKYWNGGLRHFVGFLLIKMFPQVLREEENLISSAAGAELQTAVQFTCVCKNREHPHGGQRPLSLGATQTKRGRYKVQVRKDSRCERGHRSPAAQQPECDFLLLLLIPSMNTQRSGKHPGKSLFLNRSGCSRFH